MVQSAAGLVIRFFRFDRLFWCLPSILSDAAFPLAMIVVLVVAIPVLVSHAREAEMNWVPDRGEYPGNRKPKPLVFPDPVRHTIEIANIPILRLPELIELKLASGMTSPGRLKDLADVQELIHVLRLPADFSDQLNPYVRGKFIELWDGVRQEEQENPG